MGKAFLVWRLAVKDVRHRPVWLPCCWSRSQPGGDADPRARAASTADNPYARTRAATKGPDVVATDFNGDPQAPAQASDVVPLEHAPGVVAYSGPFPVTWASLQIGRTRATAAVEGRSAAPSAVDRPRLTRGSWVRPGGVVVEAGFASALGLHVGDRLRLGGSSFEVVGIAVTVAFPSYPDSLGSFLVGSLGSYSLGLVWVSEADVARLAVVGSEPVFYYLDLKLDDPAAARAFADRYTTGSSSQQTSGPRREAAPAPRRPRSPCTPGSSSAAKMCDCSPGRRWSCTPVAGCSRFWRLPAWRGLVGVAWPSRLVGSVC